MICGSVESAHPLRRSCHRMCLVLIGLLAMGWAVGCSTNTWTSSGGDLALHSATDPQQTLGAAFDTALYGYRDKHALHAVLIAGPVDQPTQAVHLSLAWEAQAGKTPVSDRATNAVLRYVVFRDGEVGVYGGAGSVSLGSSPGAASLSVSVRSAAMRLLDASEGFKDELGLAGASGSFTVTRDDAAALRLRRALRTLVTQHLGYPRLVDSLPQDSEPTHAAGG